MKQITVTKNCKSITEFLSQNYPLMKAGTLNKFFRLNKIKLNGKKAPLNTPLKNGDMLNLYIDDRYFLIPGRDNAFMFSAKNIDIIYEDENLLVVNKPAGIPVIDEDWKNFDTLINRVKNHYYLSGDSRTKPQLCHRLDTGTCGLVLIAKNRRFESFMMDVFKNRQLEKEYICVVKGIAKPAKRIHRAYLTKNSRQGFVQIWPKDRPGAKPIQTAVTVIDSYGDFSLLKVGLITGRTHQIRAHLAYLGHPILGDSRYGINTLNRKYKMKYQALCSRRIKFGTITDSRYSYLSGKELTCPLPWFAESFEKREF